VVALFRRAHAWAASVIPLTLLSFVVFLWLPVRVTLHPSCSKRLGLDPALMSNIRSWRDR